MPASLLAAAFAAAPAALLALQPAADRPWLEAGPLTPLAGEDGAMIAPARGVWRSRGYGWVLQIDEDGVTRHQEGAQCYRSPASAAGLSAMASVEYRYMRALPGGDRAIFQLLDGDTNVVFDRLDALPPACREAAPSSPRRLADAFLDHFERHYAFFDRRPPDFDARRARLEAAMAPDMDEAALWDALSAFMTGLSDSHTKLIGHVDGELRRVQDGQGETLPRIRAGMGERDWLVGLIDRARAELGDTARQALNERVLWGVIDGRVGYLQVFVMGGFTDREDFASPEWAEAELAALNAELDAAFSAFAGLDAVIVDLSNNRGGWDRVAKTLPGRFTDAPFVGFTTQARGSGQAPFPHTITPADGPRFTDGPVYLLTSDVTVSGGELASLAFRQLPQVIHAGGTTRGAFSTPLAKPLPNGWLLELSNEVFAAPDGATYEETGLAPALPLTVFPAADPVDGHWRAVRALVAHAESADPAPR